MDEAEVAVGGFVVAGCQPSGILEFIKRDLSPRIEIEEGLRLAAKKSLDKMLEMAAGTVGKGDLGGRT